MQPTCVSVNPGVWNIDRTQWDATGIDSAGRALHWSYQPGTNPGQGVMNVEILPIPEA